MSYDGDVNRGKRQINLAGSGLPGGSRNAFIRIARQAHGLVGNYM